MKIKEVVNLKKTSLIVNIVVIIIFVLYLVLSLYIDYPKWFKILVLGVYFVFSVIRTILYVRYSKQNKK